MRALGAREGFCGGNFPLIKSLLITNQVATPNFLETKAGLKIKGLAHPLAGSIEKDSVGVKCCFYSGLNPVLVSLEIIPIKKCLTCCKIFNIGQITSDLSYIV